MYAELLFTVEQLTTYNIKRVKVIVDLTEKVKNPKIQIKPENDKEISELLTPFKNNDTMDINAIK